MGALGGPLVFSLGGEGLSGGKPWITNLVPKPGADEVNLLRPIQFSVRDAETFIDPAQLLVEVGYAKVHSEAEDLFDKILPRTRRTTLLSGNIGSEPKISKTSDGIQITRTLTSPQRSVYATSVEAGSGYSSAMVSALVRPDVISAAIVSNDGPLNDSVFPGFGLPLPYANTASTTANGVVIGIEHGPREKVAYLWLQQPGEGTRRARLTGYLVDGEDSPLNLSVDFDWTGFHRYTLVWNEALGFLEVYADLSGATTRLFRVPISSVPDIPADYQVRAGGAGDIVGLYGQEGSAGDQSTWANIAVTSDVGYPILGNIRPGSFRATTQSAEFVLADGETDPRDADISAWFLAPESVISDLDEAATSSSVGGTFRMTKATLGKTFALYREEPGLLRSNSEGFCLQASVLGSNTKQHEASTGMGFVIYDGQTVFQITLFNDFAVKTIGLLRKGGSPHDITDHILPDTALDWSTGKSFRFVMDPRRSLLQVFSVEDSATPKMSIPFSRDDLPSGEDMGWEGFTPFVAFGHTTAVDTQGTFILEKLKLCHLYQSWEASSEGDPALSNPPFSVETLGSPSLADDSGIYRISSPIGALAKIHREAPFSHNRGAIAEARLRITSHRVRARTGVSLLLDDGLRTYALSFVDSFTGKYAAISLRSELGGLREITGKDGDGAKLSFPIDWSQFHTYRIERRPHSGVHVFVDSERVARISFPEADLGELPDPQFGGTPSLAFGQFGSEGATSEWSFVRGFFSGGYEVSFKKNRPDAALRDELFATQAIVVAYAMDSD